MKITNGLLTTEEQHKLNIASKGSGFACNLKSLDSVGVCPNGELTTLIGPKGNGKSAFVKTVIYNAAANKVKTLVVLSEEKSEIYKKPIYDSFVKTVKQENIGPYLENVFYTTMLDWDPSQKNSEFFLGFLSSQIKSGIELIIFDNFTTSFLGRDNINQQGRHVEDLRQMAGKTNSMLLCVFHTAKGTNIYDRLIDGDDVRGNATSTNIAGYNYVLTTYFRADPPRTILHVDKARYHPRVNKTYWELKYDLNTGMFLQDEKINAVTADKLRAHYKKMEKL